MLLADSLPAVLRLNVGFVHHLQLGCPSPRFFASQTARGIEAVRRQPETRFRSCRRRQSSGFTTSSLTDSALTSSIVDEERLRSEVRPGSELNCDSHRPVGCSGSYRQAKGRPGPLTRWRRSFADCPVLTMESVATHRPGPSRSMPHPHPGIAQSRTSRSVSPIPRTRHVHPGSHAVPPAFVELASAGRGSK